VGSTLLNIVIPAKELVNLFAKQLDHWCASFDMALRAKLRMRIFLNAINKISSS